MVSLSLYLTQHKRLQNWDLFSKELTERHLLHKVVRQLHFHFYHVYKMYNHLNGILDVMRKMSNQICE